MLNIYFIYFDITVKFKAIIILISASLVFIIQKFSVFHSLFNFILLIDSLFIDTPYLRVKIIYKNILLVKFLSHKGFFCK